MFWRREELSCKVVASGVQLSQTGTTRRWLVLGLVQEAGGSKRTVGQVKVMDGEGSKGSKTPSWRSRRSLSRQVNAVASGVGRLSKGAAAGQ